MGALSPDELADSKEEHGDAWLSSVAVLYSRGGVSNSKGDYTDKLPT